MKPILPGSTIGLLGGGQLGRMFALEARRMGYRIHTLSPDLDTPTGQISDVEICSAYEDLDAVRAFASKVDVITFEFENVPFATAEAAAQFTPVRPAGAVLHVTQQRLREKMFLQGAGLPLANFRSVESLDGLRSAIAELGCPAILKSADFGYDGKGQCVITAPENAESAWKALDGRPAVLEAFVNFACELSVVAARSVTGEFAHFGLAENRHSNHVLDFTVAPARVSDRIAGDAVEIARLVLEKLDVVGVLCVEFFLTQEGNLIINELAPRPHNSGHFTLDACLTSQFEQQLRAICGLSLGSTKQHAPAAMANLFGDLWTDGEPDWLALSARPEVKLHLYGKCAPRPGRKMGHLCAIERDAEAALRAVQQGRESLRRLR